jgi:SAM-dependent methyltransferase
MPVASIAYDGPSFQKFLSWTNEKQILGDEILKLIKPSYKSLLDVGAGNGDLTGYYIGLFEEALLLEPAQQYYERLLERFQGARVMKFKAEDFRSNGSHFDLIVASHIFYYVTKPLEVINHLLASLNEGGRFVIILADRNCSYLRFIDQFSSIIFGDKIDRPEVQWSDIVAFLAKESLSVEVRDVSSIVNAPSIEDFLSMDEFLFGVDISHASGDVMDEMRTYLQGYLTEDGLIIDVGHKFIVVEK